MRERKRSTEVDPEVPLKPAPPDWDAIESSALQSERGSDRLRYHNPSQQSLEEEDDNAFQRSDEALPSDEGEQVIDNNPARRFDRFEE